MSLKELGVKPIINADGCATLLGGSTIGDEAIEAWKDAAKVYVDMKDLHKKAGRYLAGLVGAEGAYVASGATAGLVLSTAACVTRGELENILTIPEPTSSNEVVVQRLHRYAFVPALRLAGAKIIEVGNEYATKPEDLEQALTDRTAAVMYFVFDPQDGVLPLDRVIQIAHSKHVPVIVDSASELPPVENLRKFLAMGADLVVFSGGKALGGPNDTGIIFGRSALIEICARIGPHNYETVGSETRTFVGRPMKVGKEDILSLIAAFRSYLRRDHQAEMRRWERMAELMTVELKQTGFSAIRVMYPSFGHSVRPLTIARVEIDFDNAGSGITANQVAEELKAGDPPIYVYTRNNKVYINPQCLADGEDVVIISRLSGILRKN